jgi:replication factor A1
VTNNGDGTWYCERCDQALLSCEYRYALPCQIQDHTGVTFATAFQDCGREIIGCGAQDLSDIREEDEAKFAKVIRGISFQLYLFKVKVVEEMFSDEMRTNCSIDKAEKLDPLKESGYLLGAIDSILQGDSGTHPEVQGAAAYTAGLNNSRKSVPTSQ